MEAYGSVLVDQAVYARRNCPSVPVLISSSCIQSGVPGGNFLRRSPSQQLLSCYGALFPAPRPPLFSSSPSPLPPPAYRSLPPGPHLLQQSSSPPLLPLPVSRSFSLPSPSPPASAMRAAGPGVTARADNRDQKKKKKPRPSPPKGSQPGGRPHKEPPAASAPGRIPKSAAATAVINDEAAKDGGDFTDDVYALSPPPSSLPMPRFSLRAREASSSSRSSSPCGAAALGAEVYAGASDDLRQLHRL